MKNDRTLQLINYWRSSLADASRINIKSEEIESTEKIDRTEIKAGQISPDLASRIIRQQSEIRDNRKIQKACFDLSGEENSEMFEPLTADVLICPIFAVYRRSYRLGEQGREKLLTPIWLTAKLSETGIIEPSDDLFVWIPRELLEPSENTFDVIGDIETVDKFVSLNPAPQNAADKSAAPRWEDFYSYANQMLKAVSGQSFEEFRYDNYETPSHSLILVKDDLTNDRMRQGIIDLYTRLKQQAEKGKVLPELFRKFASTQETPLKPLLTEIENLEKSALHYGQMELKGKFALSLSQREALHHFMTLKDGEILAVNGPPGTGKTTLLQSIVATLWVEAAVEGKRQPPVIVAASTNNQAVTNVINDFGMQPDCDSLLAGRWLPDVTSYGLYCPSATKKKDAAVRYQITLANKNYPENGFFLPVSKQTGDKNIDQPINIEDEDFVRKAEVYFMTRCREYAGREFSTVEEAAEFLRLELISITDAIKTGLHLYINLRQLQEASINADMPDTKTSTSIWEKILLFFKLVKTQKEIIKVKRETAERDFADWQNRNNLKFEPPNLLDEMDKTLRGKAFQLATHYWEGAWLIEMREQFSEGYEERKSVEKQKKRWRRYAKIAPCFVSTFHQLPRFFTAFQGTEVPLFDFIDLLIVDEAGQVSPEVAGASFALAKKALVVGDTLQIEPVRQLSLNIDIGNAKKYALASSETAYDTFFDSGLSISYGSVMQIAQRASKYRKIDKHGEYERGMFLAEHRRCLPDIIGYCNDLAYKGRLIPKRELTENEMEKGFCFPAMGYRHIESQSEKVGGSRNNLSEAETIVQWILNNQKRIVEHYGEDLVKILGIITPFRAQTELIKKELSKYKSELSNAGDIKVGSVHSLQGAERSIIIFSPVNGTEDKSYFFDGKPNMLNVAVSRAKDSFLVFGNCKIFKSEIARRPAKLLEKYLLSDISKEL